MVLNRTCGEDDVDGTPFGRYRLLELLGRGGMGEVWRAYDTDTDRVVALKVLPPHLAQDSAFSERFRREAHAAARLNNPHIIPIHHYGEIDGRLYVDMRLIERRDLQNMLAAGPIDPARAVRIIEQVAKALHAAHKVGLVHRDVKPSNILLDEDDFAYLIDFGIARALDETRLTGTGNTVGTFLYMAPERLGERPDEDSRADIYALACVLYECLTGRPPFAGASVGSLVAAHLNTPPPRPSTSQPNVPPQVDQVIATGMAKDPDQRYSTTVELASAAHDAITTPIPRPARAAPPPPTMTPHPPPPTASGPPAAPQPPVTHPTVSAPPPGPTLAATPQQQPADQPSTPHLYPSPPRLAALPPGGLVRQNRRRLLGLAAGAAVVIAIAALVAYLVIGRTSPPSPQVVLPFTDLNQPEGVAVDTAGTVYVTNTYNHRVVKLAAGASSPVELPFTGLNRPSAVAVDAAGTVYVTDEDNHRVLKLAAGASSPVELPFPGLNKPEGVAVDDTGTVYVTDPENHRVLKLATGATSPIELPFTGLDYPYGVAVDAAGTLYVADPSNDRVVKLAAGASSPVELPITGLNYPHGVAVDAAGTLYITDYYNNRVVKLAAGASSPVELPITGLDRPYGVAVDAAGTLYVTDNGHGRVLKLSAG